MMLFVELALLMTLTARNADEDRRHFLRRSLHWNGLGHPGMALDFATDWRAKKAMFKAWRAKRAAKKAAAPNDK